MPYRVLDKDMLQTQTAHVLTASSLPRVACWKRHNSPRWAWLSDSHSAVPLKPQSQSDIQTRVLSTGGKTHVLPSEGRGGLLLSSPQLLGFWIGSSVSQVDTPAAFEMDSHGFRPQLCTDSF